MAEIKERLKYWREVVYNVGPRKYRAIGAIYGKGRDGH